MSNPDITWTAVLARDLEDGVLDVTILQHIPAGIDGPIYAFQVATDTPLTGDERGVEFALRRYGFTVTDAGWSVVNACDGMRLSAPLERAQSDVPDGCTGARHRYPDGPGIAHDGDTCPVHETARP